MTRESEAPRVSLLTPPGSGAIAVLSVRGRGAAEQVAAFFRPFHAAGWPEGVEPGRLTYGQWVDGTDVIDDLLVGLLQSEGSEVEISSHGGPRVVEKILEGLAERGAQREAGVVDPAFFSGGLIDRDLLEALTRAKTLRGARFLLRQRQALPAALRASLDMMEHSPHEARRRLADLMQATPVAQRLIDGAAVAIVGPANAGKSTLFNYLVGREAALVSPHPGTTRDWVEAEIEVAGVPLTLWDTAGVREGADALEQRAMAAGAERMRQADLVVAVADVSVPGAQAVLDELRESAAGRRVIAVLNKSDLAASLPVQTSSAEAGRGAVAISARTGAGIDRLLQRCQEELGFHGFDDERACLVDGAALRLVQEAVNDPSALRGLLDRARHEL